MIHKIYSERGMLSGVAMLVCVTLDIEGCRNIDNLRTAINFAVNRHESLRSRIIQDCDGDAYYVLREQRVEPKIEVRDYHMELEAFINEQEKIPFCLAQGEMARFVIEDLDSRLNLKIAVHHMAGDGKSIMILADNIMTNLKEIEEGVFTYKDKPMIPLKTLDKKFFEKHIEVSDLLKGSMEEYNNKWMNDKVVFEYEDYLKVFNQYWENHKTFVKCLKVDASTMKKLCAKSRENGVTINSVICTAATQVIAEAKRMVVIADTRPENWRGMGNFAGAIMIEGGYDSNQSFWGNAKYNHNQIHTRLVDRSQALFGNAFPALLDGSFHDAVTFNVSGAFENELAENFNNLYSMRNSDCAFIISNLGANRMDTNYGSLEVKNVQFASPMIPDANCNIGVVTNGGEMSIVMEYRKNTSIDYELMLDGVEEILNSIAEEDEIEKIYQLA